MEQHPVPQNVTGFQFKLIGDITLKQFMYLVGGAVVGYLSTKFPLVPELLRWPLGAFFLLFGIGLAFVPLEERPLDRWLLAFVKSVYAPTQFVWQKQNLPPEILMGAPSSASPQSSAASQPPAKPLSQAQEYVATLPITNTSPTPPPAPVPYPFSTQPVKKLVPQSNSSTTPVPPPVSQPSKSDRPAWTISGKTVPIVKDGSQNLSFMPGSITGKRVVFEEIKKDHTTAASAGLSSDSEQLAQKLNDQIAVLQKDLAEGKVAKDRLLELQTLMSQLINERDRMSKELKNIRQKLTATPQTTIERPTIYKQVASSVQSTVKIVPPAIASKIGIPKLTSQPNVITGVIRDNKGNLLPNLIVMVKDKESVPVRALKTNRLGQFAASTPLANGGYVIEVEDPKKTFTFNLIEVVLTGAVLPPLEVSALDQRDMLRQKLTKEIFGPNQI